MNEKNPFGSWFIGNKTPNSHSNGKYPGAREDRDTKTKTIKEPHVQEYHGNESNWSIGYGKQKTVYMQVNNMQVLLYKYMCEECKYMAL